MAHSTSSLLRLESRCRLATFASLLFILLVIPATLGKSIWSSGIEVTARPTPDRSLVSCNLSSNTTVSLRQGQALAITCDVKDDKAARELALVCGLASRFVKTKKLESIPVDDATRHTYLAWFQLTAAESESTSCVLVTEGFYQRFTVQHIRQCPSPQESNHILRATLSAGNRDVNSTLQYHCSAGYNLVGTSQRTCQENGQWSGAAPHCSVRVAVSVRGEIFDNAHQAVHEVRLLANSKHPRFHCQTAGNTTNYFLKWNMFAGSNTKESSEDEWRFPYGFNRGYSPVRLSTVARKHLTETRLAVCEAVPFPYRKHQNVPSSVKLAIKIVGRKGVPDDVVMATAGSRLQYSCMRPLLRRNAQSVGSIAWRKVGQHEAMPDPLVLPAVSNSDLGQYECFLETNGILLQTVDVMERKTE